MSFPRSDDKFSIALAHAIGENNIDAVFEIASKHAGLAMKAFGSKHPNFLHYAIWLDSSKTGSAVCYEIYKSLIDLGADPNLVDRNGLNCLLFALHYPIIRADPQASAKLSLLAQHTLDLNYRAPGFGGFTPFLAAIRVPSTVDLGMQLLCNNHPSKVNLNIPVILAGNRKQYPISCALLNNIKPEYVQFLLLNGADPNLPGPNEWPPLFLCMEHTNKVEYLALLCSPSITNCNISARNHHNLNALQVLLRSHVETSTVRQKLRLLFSKHIDVRELCSVGSVGSEKISVLHYIIHDGITVQHQSVQTRDIGAQLSHEFTLSSFEHAKLSFHRTKTLRERESFHGGLPGLSSTGSNTSSPTGSHKSTLKRIVQQQQEQAQQPLVLFVNSGSQRPPFHRLTSPRASEHSLRLPLVVPQLDLPTVDIASHSVHDDQNNNTMDDLFEAANSTTIPTQFSHTNSHISNSSPFTPTPSSPIHTTAAVNPIFQTTPQRPTLRSNTNSTSNFAQLTRQSSHQSNASNISYRSTRSHATMQSYWSLPVDTIKLLTQEREAQDLIDAADLETAIQVALELIADNVPVSGEAQNDGTIARPFFPTSTISDDEPFSTHFDYDDYDHGRASTMSDSPHIFLPNSSQPQQNFEFTVVPDNNKQ